MSLLSRRLMMSARDDGGRGTPVMDDTLPETKATQPVPREAQVAPGIVLDPESGQPMEVEAGATPPPTAPPDMMGLTGDDVPQMEQPDDMQGPPS
jgi:hypothetical protein